jgi:hypothetical protein
VIALYYQVLWVNKVKAKLPAPVVQKVATNPIKNTASK